MNRKWEIRVAWQNLIVLGISIVIVIFPTLAQTYSNAADCRLIVFTNVMDFDGQQFTHISFDPEDERTPDDIVEKFGNISSFTISGGGAAIRPGSQYFTNFSGEGTEGGPISGDYRIDWGYGDIARGDQSIITITFIPPVDSVGAFFGGATGGELIVTLENGTVFKTDILSAGLDFVPDFLPSPAGECTAINGFLGVDSNSGSKIVKAVFTISNDASSLDSIFFGTALGGSHGAGPTRFPKNPFASQCAALGFPLQPSFPTTAPGQAFVFTNALDFNGLPFTHISFDPEDERTPESIASKFAGANVTSFTIFGGQAAIRPGNQYFANFPGEGTEGGPVSGDYRIDWGYFDRSAVTITFDKPVDAVGAFFGGNNEAVRSQLTVTLEDGSTFEANGQLAGLPNVPDSLPSPAGECTAINGFLGVDSNGGPRIIKVVFATHNDAASLDSIFFGTAIGGCHGPGPAGFPKNPLNSQCAALGFPLPPLFPSTTPSLINLQFSAASYSVDENRGAASITIVRAGNSMIPVNVDYTASNGTAESSIDYTATSGTLNFAAGETSKTFTVPIIDDKLNEGDETIRLILSNPSCAAALSGMCMATLTIIDNDSMPSLSISDTAVTEGDSGAVVATFNVNLSEASSRSITVDFATADGTAIAGSDYLSNAGVLTFTPGMTTQNVSIIVNGDLFNEADETFLVNLQNLINATIADGQGTGMIIDDDPLPAITAPTDVTVSTGLGATVCGKVVSDAMLGAPTFSGKGVTVTRTGVPSGNLFSVGTTIITYTVKDQAGETAIDTQTVNVTDGTPPIINPPSDVSMPATADITPCGAIISDAMLGMATVNDNCPGSIAVIRRGVPSGNLFPAGTTIITYTATDANGNQATANQTVTVVDKQPPAISCPTNIKVIAQCGSNGSVINYTVPTTNDSCSGAATVVCSPPSGSVFPVGTTTVTCTATDSANNSTSCSFTVVVQTPQKAIQDLINQVQSLGLSKGIENSLLAKLQAALKALDGCNVNTSANQLMAFINEVNAQRGKALTQGQGDQLIMVAQEIIAGLN
jgi:hypothetical protein